MQLLTMRKILAASLLLLGVQAQAVIITPGDCNIGVNCWTSDNNSQPTADSIEALVGTSTDLFMHYKAEVDGSNEEGPLAGFYETIFSNSATDPEDALIRYIMGESIQCTDCYLSIKDGNQSPALYVFDISSWNGVESISLEGFWPGNGAISNIAIWGSATSVPEPSTLAMLGIGLFGIGLAARRRKQDR